MYLSKMLNHGFEPNVGPADRIVRIVSGLAIILAAWTLLSLPVWGAVAMTLFGASWFLTGALSHCWIYSLFGLSTCDDAPMST